MKVNILRILSVRLGVEVLKKNPTCINLNTIKFLPAATVSFSKWNQYVTVGCIIDRNPIPISFEIFYSIQGIERTCFLLGTINTYMPIKGVEWYLIYK